MLVFFGGICLCLIKTGMSKSGKMNLCSIMNGKKTKELKSKNGKKEEERA